MYELTVDLFIKVLNTNDIKIQGGTIHDFLKNCSIDFFFENEHYLLYQHRKNYILIGSKNSPIELNPFEKLDWINV